MLYGRRAISTKYGIRTGDRSGAASARQSAQLFRRRAAGPPDGAVPEPDRQAPVVVGLEVLDRIEVDDVGAVHLPELRRIEPGRELRERDVHEVDTLGRVDLGVVALRLDPADALDGNGNDPVA